MAAPCPVGGMAGGDNPDRSARPAYPATTATDFGTGAAATARPAETRGGPLEAELSEASSLEPLDCIEAEHHKWLIVCDAMERVADALPDSKIEPRALGTASLCTREAMARHHAAEQQALFPLLRPYLLEDAQLLAVLDCLEEDHADLEDASEEAADILADIRAGNLKIAPDAAGYGLRCFFAFMRRHVRCELKIVLPMARRRLMDADAIKLSETLARGRRQDKVVPLDWFRRYASTP